MNYIVSCMRIRQIDVFRGLSIVLMVFFSIIARLSDSLPDILEHNEAGSLHLGDFVLPLFLFASGMSLVFFDEKRKGLSRTTYLLDVTGRFGKLVLIALFLSPFSAGEALGMDEVMLSALLFVPSIALIRYAERMIAAVAVMLLLLYIILQHSALLPDFTLHYLGGYAAAPFYLPVMLGGVLAGKRLKDIKGLFLASLIVTAVLLFLVPPYKMDVSPSFMALSVSVSLLVFMLVGDIGNGRLEYLGKRPIRYWVLMFVFLLIPLYFYSIFNGMRLPLGSGWLEATALGLLSLCLLYIISKGIDLAFKRFPIDRYFNVKKLIE